MNQFAFLLKTGLWKPALKRVFGIKPKFPQHPVLGKRIDFPWEHLPEHVCFGCSPRNFSGLKIEFFETSNADIAARSYPQEFMQGIPGVYHGGISTTILDETAAHAIAFRKNKLVVTLNLETQWFKPLNKHEEVVVSQARILRSSEKLYQMEAVLFRKDKKVSAKSQGLFYTPTYAEFKKMSGVENVPESLKEWFF